jgi:hypothetical protein
MTRWKKRILLPVGVAALCAAAVLLSGCEEDDVIGTLSSDSVTASETSTVLFPAHGILALDVASANGAITVRGEADLQTASLTVTKRSRGDTLKEAQDRVGRIRVHAELVASELRGAYRGAEQEEDVRRYSGVDFDVVVPAGCHVTVNTSNGEIEVVAVQGTTTLETSNGAVEVRAAKGSLSINTSNGRIAVVDFEGDIRADTSNGEIWIDRAAGLIDAETSNGAVYYAGRPAANAANRLRTSNGLIEVNVPADAAIRFEASVSSGKIRSALPLVGDTEGDEWLATLNAPADTNLTLRTSNGSIRIDALP